MAYSATRPFAALPLSAPAALARVLLVEDQDQLARNTTELLHLEGFSVTRAADGRQALAAAAAEPFDAVVLDVMLPGMDGFEVCRRLRGNAGTRNLIILMLTALDDTGSKLEGLDGGADDYLVKPVISTELAARLRHRLEARSDRAREVRQQRLQAIGEITATVCHEINNPLTAALGTLDLLILAGDLSPAVVSELQKCQDHLVRISRIVKRLDVVTDRTVPYLGSEKMVDLAEERTA